MSSLFLVGCGLPELGLEGGDTAVARYGRVLEVAALEELVLLLYRDRVSNAWDYETGVSVVVCHRADDIRQVNEGILTKFFPLFNFTTVNSAQAPDLRQILLDTHDREQRMLSSSRIMRTNHWMHHERSGCQMNIYSMLNHINSLSNNDNVNTNEKDKHLPRNSNSSQDDNNGKNNEEVPRIIRNIRFSEILEEFDTDSSKYTGGSNSAEREYYINMLSTWNFSALNLSTIELLKSGYYLLNDLSKRAKVSISQNKLLLLLFTLEASYHQINNFHNFKHAIDVMQATWRLCELILPNQHNVTLLLCLAAIGHDIGHPGTNNSLFWKDSKISEIFDGKSILEKFHFKLFNNLLLKIWPQIFKLINETDPSQNLIQCAILATDMSLHSNYVNLLNEHQNRSELKLTEVISLIIKAADISNVTRPLEISAKWAFLITLEFKDCMILQKCNEENSKHDLDCDFNCSCQKGTDNEDCEGKQIESDMHKYITSEDFTVEHLLTRYPMIPNGQVFFIDTFAFDFFNKLSIVFPELKFLIDNINSNKEYWMSKKKSTDLASK